MDRLTTQLNSRADTSEADITRLEGEITETKEVLGKDLSDKIKSVEGNFKNTVDATLTPAVNSLTETTAALQFRILKLESVCAFDQFTKVPASGNTVENFKRPDCRDYMRCKKGKEFESKAPTKTTDRQCQAAKTCDSSEFIAAEVSEKKDRECRKLTVCNKEQWRSKQETAVSDRVCSKVTVCGTAYVEEKKPTATSDRECKLSPKSCKDYVGIKKENGVYTIKPEGAATAFPAYCNMKRDGGGWTLVLINSDDNQPSVFRGSQLPKGLGSQTKGKYFGSPTQRNSDYKGPPYRYTKWTDLMFIVNPQASNAEGNEKWAAYKGVYPKGDKSWPDWWSSKTFRGNDKAHSNQRDGWGHELRCYKDGTANRGYKMTAGNIGGGKLSSTNMYMDPMDQGEMYEMCTAHNANTR